MKLARALLPSLLLAPLALCLAACETETATTAVVDNGLPAPLEIRGLVWGPTYFADPIAAGSSSAPLRAVPETDFAYAFAAAPGTDDLVILKSKLPLTAERGTTLHVVVSDATFEGRCTVGQPLAQADADLVADRLLPAELAGRHYDAATCTTTATDASAMANADGGPGAP
jgi:hypothetical protein